VTKEDELRTILAGNRWFMDVLAAVGACGPPNWVVGAGVIRNIVWDYLHGLDTPTPLKDVDVAFFDPSDITRERDAALERRLRAAMPSVPWDVTNQAGVHLWYESRFGYRIRPAQSIDDAVSMWPETATSVAVTLDADGEVRLIAPIGLDDLLAMRLRRNPRQISRETFTERLREKDPTRRWPLVEILSE
jgi:uncharacterized protein